ncbi:TRAP transporter substrate-binding protein [Alcaligenaceae bacterium]|nr:TRAP transporter substrate-binding protein [Alcaligenaceae bacterium]
MRSLHKMVGAISASLLMSTPFAAQTWNMATGYPDSTYHTENVRWFADKVKEATNGELVIEVHSGASMFKATELKRALRTGQVQLVEFVLSMHGNESPLYEADTIPFLAVGEAEAAKLYEVQKPMLAERFKKEGIVPLYSVLWPGNGLYLSHEINRGSDLAGAKLRAHGPIVSKFIELLGAVSVNVQFVEVPQAFSTGVVQGMFSAASNGVDLKAWEFVSNFYNFSAFHPRNVVAVNAKAWNSLSEDTRNKVMEVAKQAEERGWKLTAELHEKAAVALAEGGMKVHQPSDELVADLQKASEQLVTEWVQRAGADGELILKEMKAFREANN